MATRTICPTCERTNTSTTCDACEFSTPTTPTQTLHANATVPVTHRHRNDLPFSRRTFEGEMALLLTANANLFV